MTELSTNNNFANLMFWKKQTNNYKQDYPYIKFYNGDNTKIELVKIEGEGEERVYHKIPLESFKGRILCKTTVYEHTFSDGDSYSVLGTSSEMFDSNIDEDTLDPKFYGRPFFFIAKETKAIKEDCYKQSDIALDLKSSETIKRKDILYVDVEGYGICKMYLKLTQTIGKIKVGNNYEFQRRNPIKDGIEDIMKVYGTTVFDNVFTFTAKSYKSGQTSTTVYPVLTNPEDIIDPDLQTKQANIFMEIYQANKALYESWRNNSI